MTFLNVPGGKNTFCNFIIDGPVMIIVGIVEEPRWGESMHADEDDYDSLHDDVDVDECDDLADLHDLDDDEQINSCRNM